MLQSKHFQAIVTKYLLPLFLVVMVGVFSYGYLGAADNISGMLWGDGWNHSIFAEQIFTYGTIDYSEPRRLFYGIKVDGQVSYYPIHYTQLFHLSLGSFNSLTGLKTFSPWFGVIMNMILSLMIFILSRRLFGSRVYASIVAIAFFVLIGDRALYINFMEPFLFLYFMTFLFFLVTYIRKKDTVFLYRGMFSLGIFAATKHAGLFDSAVVIVILMCFLLWKRQFVKVLISGALFFLVIVGPYYNQWSGIGSIGYGIGTLNIPSLGGAGDFIQDTLFTSKFQRKENWVREKLSYQRDKTTYQYISGLSNYFTDFGGIQRDPSINVVYLLIVFRGLILFIIKHPLTGSILLGIYVAEVLMLIGLGQSFKQYYHLFNFTALVSGLYLVMRLIQERKTIKLMTLSCFMIILLFAFMETYGTFMFGNVGRKTTQNEILYIEMGEYIKQEGLEGIFIASDPQFGHYAKKRQIRHRSMLDQNNLEEDLEELKTYYGTDYIIVTSENYKNTGVYDYVNQKIIDELIRDGQIIKLHGIKDGDQHISLYGF